MTAAAIVRPDFRAALALLAFLLLPCAQVVAQDLPKTDLWLANINANQPTSLAGPPVKINTTVGYNNQPHFSVDGNVIYYTREVTLPNGIAQTDIAAFNLRTRTTTMVNQTMESEYSPTPIPGRNALSVIQVEADQKQRLWAISLTNGEMELLLPDAEPVGYHAWMNDQQVAMFILGDSFDLYTAKLQEAGSSKVASNIGRTLRRHPENGDIIFVDKNTEPWKISIYHSVTNSIQTIMPLFPDSEDFTVDRNGAYWTGNGSKLYRRSPMDARWELITDFGAYGVRNISRLAISPANDKIMLTSEHQAAN